MNFMAWQEDIHFIPGEDFEQEKLLSEKFWTEFCLGFMPPFKDPSSIFAGKFKKNPVSSSDTQNLLWRFLGTFLFQITS